MIALSAYSRGTRFPQARGVSRVERDFALRGRIERSITGRFWTSFGALSGPNETADFDTISSARGAQGSGPEPSATYFIGALPICGNTGFMGAAERQRRAWYGTDHA